MADLLALFGPMPAFRVRNDPPPGTATEDDLFAIADREMAQKLEDYFAAGTRLVWYFDPKAKSVSVYTSPRVVAVLGETDTLDGGDVLPGFTLALAAFFRQPDWLDFG